jgi:hypothetical protein
MRCCGLFLALLLRGTLPADPVPVRFLLGSAHGFVVIKTLEGERIGIGDMIQTVHGDRVTCRVTLRFRDGSRDDETTVFTQRTVFRLISDHHIQRGPSFPNPIDFRIDALTGEVTNRTKEGKISAEHLDIPADVANGLPPNLLMNLVASVPETKLSFIVPTEKPRLIHLSIKPAGQVSFTVGGTPRKAIDYVIHPELGGITGAIAPLVGKQPADFHIWILAGPAPAFIREEGQLYEGGPICRIEQVSPTFPAGHESKK